MYELTPLHKQLSNAPRQFLTALTCGNDALLDFDNHWNALTAQVICGVQSCSLPTDILQVAHNSATLIATYGDSFAALENSVTSMVAETTGALERLTLADTLSSSRCLRLESPQPPSYIPEAYRWLLDNVHNPYPSSQTKHSLARQSGLKPAEIRGWFKDVRRTIGWIEFCKKHFSGSRALAIEAATRVLVEQEASCHVPLEVKVDILSLQGAVECLYPAYQDSLQSNGDPLSISPFLPRLRKESGWSTSLRIDCDEFPDYNSNRQSDIVRHEVASNYLPSNISQNPRRETTTKMLTSVCTSKIKQSPYLPNFTSSSASSLRKRRLSDAGIDETRRDILPGKRRKQVVSDPFPSRSNSNDFDIFWTSLFTPATTSPTIDPSIPMPTTIIPPQCSPPVNAEDMAILSSFIASLVPENTQEPVSYNTPAPTARDEAPSQMLSLTELFTSTESSLAIDPSEALEPLSSLDTCLDFSSLSSADSSSDTSSVLTMSPPRTPAISSSPGLPSSDGIHILNLDGSVNPDKDSTASSFFPNPQLFRGSSILDDLLREMEFGKNATTNTSSLTEVFSLFDPTSSAIQFDLSYEPPLSV